MSQEEAEEVLAPKINLADLEWTHAGVILGRGPAGSFDAAGVGDPCISFDSELMRWRLFYTGRDEEDRTVCAQLLSQRPDLIGPGQWLPEERSPLTLANPEVLAGRNWSQPCPIFDPLRSSYEPALIDGLYWLLCMVDDTHIYAASSRSLSGPWTLLEQPLMSWYMADVLGTPMGNWFPARQEVLIFVSTPMRVKMLSWKPGTTGIQGIGEPLEPGDTDEHWTAYRGPIQGLQLLPGQEHLWYGLLNVGASSSLAGFAYTDEEWPVSGWHWLDQPIEQIEQIPPEAQAWGEGIRLGRHSMLVLPGGGLRLFYESGPRGQQQIFLKRARQQ
jgi:hypothetical protein